MVIPGQPIPEASIFNKWLVYGGKQKVFRLHFKEAQKGFFIAAVFVKQWKREALWE